MPTLDWIGKKAVVRHHAEVPFHLLKEEPALSGGGRESHCAEGQSKSTQGFASALRRAGEMHLY